MNLMIKRKRFMINLVFIWTVYCGRIIGMMENGGILESYLFLSQKILENESKIFEMNEDNIKSQNYCIKILALYLNQLNIPYDISQKILSYALGDIYIEPCIFQIMPDDILDLFTNKKNSIVLTNRVKKKYVLIPGK